uniref:Uncharacterized protein n=1 Tax=Arundo donax TaxID=35708 RepID=A0A0A9MJZ6_ARUDO
MQNIGQLSVDNTLTIVLRIKLSVNNALIVVLNINKFESKTRYIYEMNEFH